jgi:hypothetical protein
METAGNSSSLIVVVPFVGWQSEWVFRNLDSIWPRVPPCESDLHPKPELFFYFHKDISRSRFALSEIQRLFRKHENVSRCFASLQFLNAGLSDAEDVYPLAAARMFFRLFKSKRLAQYKTMYYMEPDNLPCRAGWLTALGRESHVPGGFWVRGSILRDGIEDTGRYPYAAHINGNALYAIGDQAFREFLSKVEESFWARPNDFLGGYDVALHTLRTDRSFMTWIEYTQTVHLFQYTELVQNLFRTKGNASDICRSFSSTYFIHGREISA